MTSSNTIKASPIEDVVNGQAIREMLQKACTIIEEYGYKDPIAQVVDYLMSDDPTYITAKDGARSMICKYHRDDILTVIVTDYCRFRREGVAQ
ncbi:MAG: IreB family regulatory phosphoprotein [Pseudomonadales bacterium]|nr:IreB family regulatory phosphoprotein [Pseudomonadales bacterium]